MTTWTAWLRALLPAAVPANRRERLRVVVGALLGIGLTALSTRWTGGHTVPAWPLLIAPMGATAVLIFGVPASPLAQPWSVIGGHGISALVGVACARWIGPTEAAAALAVGGAIAAMLALRCLHPPGGATALLAVISGATDPGFALQPVLANAAVLTVLCMVYNPLTRRAYPHPQLPPLRPRPSPPLSAPRSIRRWWAPSTAPPPLAKKPLSMWAIRSMKTPPCASSRP